MYNKIFPKNTKELNTSFKNNNNNFNINTIKSLENYFKRLKKRLLLK